MSEWVVRSRKRQGAMPRRWIVARLHKDAPNEIQPLSYQSQADANKKAEELNRVIRFLNRIDAA